MTDENTGATFQREMDELYGGPQDDTEKETKEEEAKEEEEEEC